ncbi:autotransporter outer membrane beta-barrel domain-containing protein [Entomomonas sp. E2T0]|uniref:autotransporter outer membrane beta-barrel domain-containing protein n=1 Tax=Entomomonas sp. E2T0 TaxID=2930213 RepID=UPI002228211B|nr:autotransporter outer membrane beta-barrel domain-containing protein [Entomomonas sp. E2T0]UYZ85076.1 autotransporter outer membrane beta-barrel domain-containing protein [Entomomonas sp. E2T0]
MQYVKIKQNQKTLVLTISVLLGVYGTTALATEYGALSGNVVLNDGDIVKVDTSQTTPVARAIGINSTAQGDKVTINGAVTIDIKAGSANPGGIGINLENGNTNNLGSGTEIKASQSGTSSIVGLQVDNQTSVIADNLNVNIDNQYNATGISVSGQSKVDLGQGGQINMQNTGIAMEVKEGSIVKADGITINTGIVNTTRNAIDVEGGSLDLGNNSTINIINNTGNGNSALYVRKSSTVASGTVNANQLTIIANNAYGVNVQDGGDVNLGSNSSIKTTGSNNRGVWAVGTGAHFEADRLNVETTGSLAQGLLAQNGGVIDIGAGSHVTTQQGIGVAGYLGTVNFKGDVANRNSITIQSQIGAQAQGSTGLVNLANTDIIVNSSGGLAIGVRAVSGGVINGENISFKMSEGSTLAVVAQQGGKVTLTGETNIDAASNSQSAFYTQDANSNIKLTGKANIKGNIAASGNGSLIDLNMDAGSILTGTSAIDTSTTAKVNLAMTGSTWNMIDSSDVTNLTLNNSTVNFTNSNFTTLTTDSLQGNGLFNIHTDIVGQTGDLIVVNGTATGNHRLNVVNNGSAATDGTETLTVVSTGLNQASFSLANKVELGAYEYGLRASPTAANDVELYSTGQRSLTTTAQAAGSFLNIGYLTNYIENQTLLQRLGDLRNNEAMSVKTGGLWLKSFGGKLSSFSGTALDGFDMSYMGTQGGIDKQLDVANGNLVVGAMAGFTRTNPNYRGGDGNGKNYIAGLYATYFLDNGLYVDTVLKYNSMRNHFNVKDTAGTGIKGTGKTSGVNLSTEVGKRFWLGERNTSFYIEPQAQLTYGYQDGDTVHASNGLKVGLSHYNSILGRVSGVIGYQVQGENPVNVYLKSGIVREMSGGATYKFNDSSKQDHSFRSSWFDNGIGINMNLNKQHNIYAEFDYAKGNHFDKKQLDVGYRYSF